MAYVYIYDVPGLDAVKIGKTSSSSKDRMWDYAETHGFHPDASSLKTFHVGDHAYDDIENILHRKIKLRRFYWGNATEMFDKNGRVYESIVEEMGSIIRESTNHDGSVKMVSNVDWGKLAVTGLGALLSGGKRSRGFQNAIMKEVFGVKPRRRRRKGWLF